MAEHNVSAIVVCDSANALLGIVTERDMTRRVVAKGHPPKDTTLAEIMTENVQTVRPTDTPFYAFRKMLDGRYRHLPIADEGRVVGMLSLRDLRLANSIASKPNRTTPFWSMFFASRRH